MKTGGRSGNNFLGSLKFLRWLCSTSEIGPYPDLPELLEIALLQKVLMVVDSRDH